MDDTPRGRQWAMEQTAKVLSGNVSFGSSIQNGGQDQNIQGFKASGTTPSSANTEFSITHTLGRVPIGFLVLSLSAAAQIYQSTTAWTSTTIYLKCSGSSVVYALIVI
jgi:hypothetical protein